ncbi:uncharacterized protein PGTG_20080 [Puccinia graminis f. sp. tritici CRL 75-36-700-3]|uniref:Uncharacterized protein n=1 Tax=Puccinia graminis f. sp. tritici (strain CRL 75-36-700-3 / race SCCL) TaxID=418459 RepID=E3LC18_PUCGT|nr:uncharacterized protein PGTG_20080 [Puccinia graminis f. sp. tritici CRL 75-36-700-3]EFP94093.1 hypothetical protein PGTG_20080 [Puccinia graminis f. sp. tritici CRL 75-36-700-3]
MAVDKAARSQRARRAAESVKKKIAPPLILPKTKKPKPIENPNNQELSDDANGQSTNSSEIGDIFEVYDEEVALADEAHQIMQWCNEEHSDNNDDESKEVVKFLWPISFSNDTEAQKRKLKSGRLGYLLPVPNPSGNSQKLVPRKLTRTTKHNYQVNRNNALGKNNGIMAAFLKKGKEQSEERVNNDMSSPGQSPVNISSSSLNTNARNNEAYENHIASSVNKYLANKLCKPAYDERKIFEDKFKRLNDAISLLKLEYRHREKIDKKKKYSGFELDELQEFNNLRHENRMNGVPHPAIAASITTAASSNRRLQSGIKKFSTSVGRARRIQAQARHVLCFKELSTSNQGKGAKQKSILDDPVIFQTLSSWSAAQKPGHVTPRSFHEHVINNVLPQHGHKSIHIDTATQWMYKLGFRAQKHRKSIYYDGHERKQHKASRLSLADAATVIYPGSQGDPWWDMKQLCAQVVEKAIPIFEALHPGSQGVFVFDCSSAHEAYGPNALRVQNMNLSLGGKQARMCDTIIPSDDPLIPEHLRGQHQAMCFPADYVVQSLANEPKGIEQVLSEHGIWQHHISSCIDQRLPRLHLRCKQCAQTGAVKDAKIRAATMVKRAEAHGYFLNYEQCMDNVRAPLGWVGSP